MIQRPSRSTRTATLCPYTTLCRSAGILRSGVTPPASVSGVCEHPHDSDRTGWAEVGVADDAGRLSWSHAVDLQSCEPLWPLRPRPERPDLFWTACSVRRLIGL